MNKKEYVTLNGSPYGIMEIKYNSHSLPVVMNAIDYNKIKQLNLKWRYINKGYIVATYKKKDGTLKDITLHDLIIKFSNKLTKNDDNKKIYTHHINRIGLDNRRDNLSDSNNLHSRNIRKKKRIIKLPDNCGINPDDIPTYVWYIKEHQSHGDRFMIKIGNYSWKTTSSKQYSTLYKFEQAKAFLRELKKKDPELFTNISMNGDYNKLGESLAKSFYDIIYAAGYNNISRDMFNTNTDLLLKPGNLTQKGKKEIKNTINNIFNSSSSTEDYYS